MVSRSSASVAGTVIASAAAALAADCGAGRWGVDGVLGVFPPTTGEGDPVGVGVGDDVGVGDPVGVGLGVGDGDGRGEAVGLGEGVVVGGASGVGDGDGVVVPGAVGVVVEGSGAGTVAVGAAGPTCPRYFANTSTPQVVPPLLKKEMPMSVKSPRMFALCPLELIHASCMALAVACPLATFSPTLLHPDGTWLE